MPVHVTDSNERALALSTDALHPLRTDALHPLRNDGVPFCMRTFIVPLLCTDIVPLGAITHGYCWSECCYVPLVMEDIVCLEGTAHTLLVMRLTCKKWRDDLVNFVPVKYRWKWSGWKQTTRDYFELRRRMQQQAEDEAKTQRRKDRRDRLLNKQRWGSMY